MNISNLILRKFAYLLAWQPKAAHPKLERKLMNFGQILPMKSINALADNNRFLIILPDLKMICYSLYSKECLLLILMKKMMMMNGVMLYLLHVACKSSLFFLKMMSWTLLLVLLHKI